MEFAIIAPLFFMIAFATFTGALTFNQKNQLTHAAREGSRFGAVLPEDQFGPGDGDAWAQAVIDTTRDRAFGDLDAAVPGSRICVALVEGDPGSVVSGDTSYAKDTTGTLPADGGGLCFNDGGADGGRRVQVRVFRNGNINAVLWNMDLSLQSQSTTRKEAEATGS